MKLTDNQKQWLLKKTIKVDRLYMFPRFGFKIYLRPDFDRPIDVDNNPFTKSLDHEHFYVKEKINGFVKGNFYYKPVPDDFYLLESDLAQRGIFEHVILLIFAVGPMLIYNAYKSLKKPSVLDLKYNPLTKLYFRLCALYGWIEGKIRRHYKTMTFYTLAGSVPLIIASVLIFTDKLLNYDYGIGITILTALFFYNILVILNFWTLYEWQKHAE